jgi:hypothetical protein
MLSASLMKVFLLLAADELLAIAASEAIREAGADNLVLLLQGCLAAGDVIAEGRPLCAA